MNAVEIENLNFSYADRPLFSGISLKFPLFSRNLLLGANGVGKSTLLRIIAGKHLVASDSLKVLGQDPFSGELSPRDITLIGDRFPLDLDLSVSELLEGARKRQGQKFDQNYEEELVDLLRINPAWRMHRVSNGQRRRVDLLLSFLNRPKLVLLDEVTSDLDILGRQDLLSWMKNQTDSQRMTIIFATHILDGMQQWASHLAFLSPGRVRTMSALENLPDWQLANEQKPHSPLLWLSEKWLREDLRVQRGE